MNQFNPKPMAKKLNPAKNLKEIERKIEDERKKLPYEIKPENLQILIRDTDITLKINPDAHLDPIRRQFLEHVEEIQEKLKKMEAAGVSQLKQEDFIIAKNAEILETVLLNFKYEDYAKNRKLPPAIWQQIVWDLKDFLVDSGGAPGIKLSQTAFSINTLIRSISPPISATSTRPSAAQSQGMAR